jgi:hypothetical protein
MFHLTKHFTKLYCKKNPQQRAGHHLVVLMSGLSYLMQGNLFDLSPEQHAHMNLLGMGDLVKTPTINLRRLLGHSIAKDNNYLKHDLVSYSHEAK